MNKKELEKIRGEFFEQIHLDSWQSERKDFIWMHDTLSNTWRWMEKEIKEAHHKGYMKGYRMAGDHFEKLLSQRYDDLLKSTSTDQSPFTQDSLDEFYRYFEGDKES